MTMYIDSDFKCHVSDDGTLRPVETDFFDGKCAEFIEGYRFVPSGETWTRSDGVQFPGEMVSPWKDYSALAQLQALYDRMLAQQQDMAAALAAIYEGATE